MKIDKTQLRLAKEILGVALMIGSLCLAAAFLAAVAGPGATVVTAALLALARLGRRLASGTATETDSETEGDFEPIGPGPLWQDPTDPQAFIPRPERD